MAYFLTSDQVSFIKTSGEPEVSDIHPESSGLCGIVGILVDRVTIY